MFTSQIFRVRAGVERPRSSSSLLKLLSIMRLVTLEAKNVPRSVLPPSRGRTLSDGPPPSFSPRPPEMVIVTSRALPMSATYEDTPAPLNAEPTLMPSMFSRPSLLRPPAPPKTTIPGTTWLSMAAPACVTVFGISCIRLAYPRDAGRAAINSLSMVI